MGFSWWTIWDPLCCHVDLHECKYVVLKNEDLCNHLPAKSLVVVQPKTSRSFFSRRT